MTEPVGSEPNAIEGESKTLPAEPPSRRRKVLKRIFVGILVLLVCQSFTITMPIRGRVVDAETGRPIHGAQVAGLWQLDLNAILHKLPGGTVHISRVRTDGDGRFTLPLAIIVHAPLMPFSLLYRSDSDMPLVLVVADGYGVMSDTNDVFGINGPPHSAGFLFLRVSSVQNSEFRLTPVTSLSRRAKTLNTTESRLQYAESEIWLAQASCRSSYDMRDEATQHDAGYDCARRQRPAESEDSTELSPDSQGRLRHECQVLRRSADAVYDAGTEYTVRRLRGRYTRRTDEVSHTPHQCSQIPSQARCSSLESRTRKSRVSIFVRSLTTTSAGERSQGRAQGRALRGRAIVERALSAPLHRSSAGWHWIDCLRLS